MTTYVRSLNEHVELADVGGKGLSLARLAAAGFDVPAGFLLTTSAYAAFVADHHLGAELSGLAALTPQDTEAVERAAATVRSRFVDQPISAPVREQVVAAYQRLGRPPVAVRSSATAEDLPEASFAGQQDTFLNVRGVEPLLDAVRRCWASLWTARAVSYRAQQGWGDAEVRLAVVVQLMVDADAAGVLFTADPVTGTTDAVEIDAAWGLGEAVVGGLVTPDVFRVDRVSGELRARTVNPKQTMTVRTDSGTTEVAVPDEQVLAASLTHDQVRRLARQGRDLEDFFGHPVDVEWARVADRLYLLQARPITAADRDPWNDSRKGDYLWTSTNVGEAVPDVMTPATWGLVRLFLNDAMATSSVPPYVAYGRIGGRLYLNLSMAASIARRLGLRDKAFRSMTAEIFGRIPAEIEIPQVFVPRRWVVRRVLPVAARVVLQATREAPRLPHRLAATPSAVLSCAA